MHQSKAIAFHGGARGTSNRDDAEVQSERDIQIESAYTQAYSAYGKSVKSYVPVEIKSAYSLGLDSNQTLKMFDGQDLSSVQSKCGKFVYHLAIVDYMRKTGVAHKAANILSDREVNAENYAQTIKDRI